jgi:hypothetical protein
VGFPQKILRLPKTVLGTFNSSPLKSFPYIFYIFIWCKHWNLQESVKFLEGLMVSHYRLDALRNQSLRWNLVCRIFSKEWLLVFPRQRAFHDCKSLSVDNSRKGPEWGSAAKTAIPAGQLKAIISTPHNWSNEFFIGEIPELPKCAYWFLNTRKQIWHSTKKTPLIQTVYNIVEYNFLCSKISQAEAIQCAILILYQI